MSKDKKADDGLTVSGTNIADVKRQNEHSGLTYNEIKAVLAERIVANDVVADSGTNTERNKN